MDDLARQKVRGGLAYRAGLDRQGLGGDVSKFVFPSVEKRLQDKVAAMGGPVA